MTHSHIRLIALLTGLLTALIPALQASPESILSFAILGDAEPKPEARFPNLSDAVDDINRLAAAGIIEFAAGIGDLPHKGTLEQYVAVTPHLRSLKVPFYPIMGNEEHGASVERFLEFANLWNKGKVMIEGTRYVIERDAIALVFASPDYSRQFSDEGIDWLLTTIDDLAPKPVMLLVHAAQVGVFPENPEKGVTHPRFAAEVVTRANLQVVISGDLHLDMDRVEHSKQIGSVHYLHIPALERTKLPDATRHRPMFRVVHVMDNGEVRVDTYETRQRIPLDRHDYRFNIELPPLRQQP
ncbi:MAG: serine/threonine protein phosphatase [Puniceicoccaceae bacterium]